MIEPFAATRALTRLRRSAILGAASVVGLAFWGVYGTVSALAAGMPAGIVMSVSGTTDPPLSQMTEIMAGDAITMGADSRLTFLDYARCKLVTVSGGTLTLSQSDYRMDGRVESEADGPCPQSYSITMSGGTAPTTAGLVMRGALGPPRWPVNAQFLLTGSHASVFRSAGVFTEDKPEHQAASLDIAGGKAVVAPGTLPLPPNHRYVLRLFPADQSKPTEIVFVGTAPSEPQPVVVLRLD